MTTVQAEIASTQQEYAEYRSKLLSGQIEPQRVECIEVGCTNLLSLKAVADGKEKCYECLAYLSGYNNHELRHSLRTDDLGDAMSFENPLEDLEDEDEFA